MIANVAPGEVVDAIEANWRLHLGSYFASVHDLDGAIYGLGGRIVEHYFNFAGLIRAKAGREEHLVHRIVEFAREHGRVPVVYIDPTVSPADFAEVLAKKGFDHKEDDIWMWYEPGRGGRCCEASELRIERVVDRRGMAAFIDIFNEAYEMLEEGDPESPYSQALLDAFASPPANVTIEHYVGCFGGRPVSVGSLYACGASAGLYNVCTLPCERGKGFASAVSRAVIQRSEALKHRRLMLQTELGGEAESLYSSLGFSQAFSGSFWTMPSAVPE